MNMQPIIHGKFVKNLLREIESLLTPLTVKAFFLGLSLIRVPQKICPNAEFPFFAEWSLFGI